MKFKITMKDPDGYFDSVNNAVCKDVAATGLEKDEMDRIVEMRQDKINKLLERWFRYQEYVTIEIDTEANTATVCRDDG